MTKGGQKSQKIDDVFYEWPPSKTIKIRIPKLVNSYFKTSTSIS